MFACSVTLLFVVEKQLKNESNKVMLLFKAALLSPLLHSSFQYCALNCDAPKPTTPVMSLLYHYYNSTLFTLINMRLIC